MWQLACWLVPVIQWLPHRYWEFWLCNIKIFLLYIQYSIIASDILKGTKSVVLKPWNIWTNPFSSWNKHYIMESVFAVGQQPVCTSLRLNYCRSFLQFSERKLQPASPQDKQAALSNQARFRTDAALVFRKQNYWWVKTLYEAAAALVYSITKLRENYRLHRFEDVCVCVCVKQLKSQSQSGDSDSTFAPTSSQQLGASRSESKRKKNTRL